MVKNIRSMSFEDVVNDFEINAKDVVKIRRYIAGWSNIV